MPLGLEAVLMEGGALAPAEAGPVDGPETGLVQRILAGDAEAFAELMALTEGTVLAVAWRLLGDRDQARDAAQDVFLRSYRSLGSFRLGENFRGWLYRITVNVCLDHIRKRGPVMAPAEVLDWHAPVRDPLAEEALLLQERRLLVREALGGLTPAERSALVLRDLEGLATDEVARALGIKAVTVRSQLSSARAKVQAFCARRVRRSSGGLP